MSSYLEEIENEYSRGRGKLSRLSPLDWALAQKWQNEGIPLFVVIRSMQNVIAAFQSSKRPGTINTLSYFTQEVEKQFAEWNSTQIGKNSDAVESIFSEEEETFICLNCKFYKNDSDDFYNGSCRAASLRVNFDGEGQPTIFEARVQCNPEHETEQPENYQFFEPK